MRRAPARPVRACFLRKWCPVSHVTFEAPLRTSHFTLLTAHFTLHTSHFTLHTSHCTRRTRRTPHFTLPTLHSPHFTLLTAFFTLHTSHFTLHTSHCTLHAPHFTLHTSSHLSSSHLIPAHLFSSHLFLPWEIWDRTCNPSSFAAYHLQDRTCNPSSFHRRLLCHIQFDQPENKNMSCLHFSYKQCSGCLPEWLAPPNACECSLCNRSTIDPGQSAHQEAQPQPWHKRRTALSRLGNTGNRNVFCSK